MFGSGTHSVFGPHRPCQTFFGPTPFFAPPGTVA